MKITRPSTAVLILMVTVVGCIQPPAREKPAPVLRLISNGAILSGSALFSAQQTNSNLSAFDITAARFEYSKDGANWTAFKIVTGLLDDHMGYSINDWEALWDLTNLASGNYKVHVSMDTKDNQTASSPSLDVTVNKPPIARATATPVGENGVTFDASGSEDTDGTVTNWDWDFGDGNVGTGRLVQHLYSDVTQTYKVVLKVKDNLGLQSESAYDVKPPPSFSLQAQANCICKNIQLRGTKPSDNPALGEDGKGKAWPKNNGFDGTNLGPNDGLATNPKGADGERPWTAYSFEIVCDITGDPAKCKEIQLVKATFVFYGLTKEQCEQIGGTFDAASKGCAYPSTWNGKMADTAKSGTNDIDVDTAEKCKKAGGTPNPDGTCKLKFPQEGAKYGPDAVDGSDPTGAYEKPYDFKKYVDKKKIIWFDTPGFGPGVNNDSSLKADFVAIVRGTDGKYCYAKYEVRLIRKKGADEESLKQTDINVGVDSVPGVP